jgi:ABC-type dipeptide/oligopeptide/nickel transport system permease subunit
LNSGTTSLSAKLWQARGTRLCLVVLALYTLAALWGEGAYRVARYRDRTPAYNRVHEAWRYQPPAFARLFHQPSTATAEPLPAPGTRGQEPGFRPASSPGLTTGTLNAQRSTLNAEVKVEQTSAFSVLSADPTGDCRPPEPLPEPRTLNPSDATHDSRLTTHDSPLFPLGSDNLGRDVLQRLLQGTRIAFHVGVMTSLIALPLGVLLGCLGGYFGGRIDSLVVWLCATVASIPSLLLILAVSMVVGKGLAGVTWGIGLTTWVSVCRSIRAEVIKHRGRTYVEAARVLGYSHARILLRHILPNVMHIVLISFSIRFPAAVGTEVFVSFLGIGVQGEPSWGVMLNNARLRLWQGVWWEMTFVTLAIFGLVLVFNVLADRLRDLLDPTVGRMGGEA